VKVIRETGSPCCEMRPWHSPWWARLSGGIDIADLELDIAFKDPMTTPQRLILDQASRATQPALPAWLLPRQGGSNVARLLQGKAEHLVLLRPFGRQGGEAGDTHSMG
jgi:hypothetical protein